VTSSSESLKNRVDVVLDMALSTICSLTESFVSTATNTHEDGAVPMEKAGRVENSITSLINDAAMNSEKEPIAAPSGSEGSNGRKDDGDSEESDPEDTVLKVHE
jgi:cleavage and polyadenylation specificity factor subunit 3